jgi:acyl transferase domain-containing protein
MMRPTDEDHGGPPESDADRRDQGTPALGPVASPLAKDPRRRRPYVKATDSSAIAVVGLACRLPGAPSPDAFWQLLREGRDAISDVPRGRWETDRLSTGDAPAPGLSRGGFIAQVDGFDADFFGISPSEARAMDPQQRLVLELSWEALEDAGIVPDDLRRSRTGAFVGAAAGDYADLLRRGGPPALSRYALTGTNRGMIANRVSYILGLRGPSLTVDAAQASALVAVHLACESLRRGESTVALAGGVNLNLSLESAISAARFGALSPDGLCYTFDSRANGYVRGEGGGVVALKPLERAVADGNPVYCVIRGSAVNNDGGGDGLTAPDRGAQEEVLRLAYRRARIEPADVQYVELHGSGTSLGDQVEAAALGTVLGACRATRDLLAVGSVKTNVGHLEGASGIAGLIKAVLCIKNREIPASLNFRAPAPTVPLAALRLRVAQTLDAWPEPARPLLAGVSSFGMGGTNCHVVIAEPPPGSDEPRETVAGSPSAPAVGVLPWVLSARSGAALRAQARQLLAYVEGRPDLEIGDVGYSLASSRARFERRAVVLGGDREQLLGGLGSLADGVPAANLVEGVADGAAGGAVFMFPGFGSQWELMACELLDRSPVFAEQIAACDEALAPFVDWSVADVLHGHEHAPDLSRTDIAAPVLFAVNVSLAALWRSCGVEPSAVVGHSHGEIAAAHVAGGLSLDEAAEHVALRSQVLTRVSGLGAMASVSLAPADLADRCARWGAGDVVIAAVNGPTSTVIAGGVAAVEEFLRRCGADGVRSRAVAIDYAAHSPHIEPLRGDLLAVFGRSAPHSGEVPLYSTVTGQPLDVARMDAQHWYRGERDPVQFERAIRELLADGHRRFVEVSAHPVLTAGTQETVEDVLGESGEVTVVSSLRRGHGGPARFLTSLAELYVRGGTVDWRALFAGSGARRTGLPTYAFQRQSFWPEAARPPETAQADGDPPASRDRRSEPGDLSGSLLRRLGGMPKAEQDRIVRELVLMQVAVVLGHVSPAAVDATRPFKDLGFDSAAALELRNGLVKVTGLRLPTSLLYDHPTPAALAAQIVAEATGLRFEAPVQTPLRSIDEPIAIVGMSCRYPGGVASPKALWDLVAAGRDAIGEFPDDRGWALEALYDPDPERPGTSYTRHGGFIYDAGQFDADFFSISPREALAMDPQQRLLLEGAWEALEDAGIAPLSLVGSRTGVFVGVTAPDYGTRLHESVESSEGYALTGLTPSVASGRLSYALGLEGAAVSIDTACSASLVAVHLACQALRSGECELALAGGAAVMANPGMFVQFSRQRGLSQDGRCKAFGAGADGTGWSEGAGLVVLEPLSHAQANGHAVLALVRGSAVNQDGASNGLTAPSGRAQESVIRQALLSAGLSPSDVDVVEAHGTGTRLGDPIEAHALLATYGQQRSNGPLYLGSLKSNIGHTQAAAGVGGLIKIVEALRHGVLPKTLHADEASPHIDWSVGAVELLREATDWSAGERVRRAGVSSFGVSGTNAHIIVEEAPCPAASPGAAAAPPVSRQGLLPFVISGATAQALRAQASRLASFAQAAPAVEPYDIASALALGRAHLAHRAVILDGGLDEGLVSRLRALERGERPGAVVQGVARAGGGVAFLFSGQGSQWAGMGAELYREFPVFAEALDEACREMDAYLERPLRDVLFAAGDSVDAALLGNTRFTQVALFALEVALYRLVTSLGIIPGFLIGHSIGEFAAAYVAGVFSLADGCRLVAARARLMGALPPLGAMLAVQASEAEAVQSIEGLGHRLAIAAVNGPRAVVISGDEQAVDEADGLWRERGRKTTRLRVSHAFHSHLMEPMLEELKVVARGVGFSAPSIPIVSNVTGQLLLAEQACSPEYWAAQVRQTVRFDDGVALLRAAGVTRFLELGPDGTLSAMAAQTGGLADQHEELFVSSLRGRRIPQREALMRFVAEVHCHGVEIDWHGLFDRHGARVVDLPTYAFQRERYWLESSAGAGDLAAAGQCSAEHPLLGAVVRLAGGQDGWVFTGRLSLRSHPWLADHVIMDVVLLPGTAFVELALVVAQRVGVGEVEDLTLVAPLVFGERGAVELQVLVGEADERGRRAIGIYSRSPLVAGDGVGDEEWVLHASGALAAGDAPAGLGQDAIDAFAAMSWPPEGAEQVDIEFVYDRLAGAGYGYGPVFQGLRKAFRAGDVWYAEVSLDGEHDAQAAEFGVHPALADAALHVILLGALDRSPVDAAPAVPFAFSGVRLYGQGAATLRVRIEQVEDGAGDGKTITLLALDADGVAVLAIDALKWRVVDHVGLQPAGARQESLYSVTWVDVPAVAPDGAILRGAVLGAPQHGVWLDAPQDGSWPQAPGVDLARYRDLAALADDLAAGVPAPQVVLAHAPHTTRSPLARAVGEITRETLELLQGWLANERLADAKLVVLTDRALPHGDQPPNLAHAALPGLLRSAQTEHPGRFAILDLDPSQAPTTGLYRALTSNEPELALRNGTPYAPRLIRATVDAAAPPQPPERDGTILITGGTGGLGALVARHLAGEHGARRLLLVSRRGPAADGVRELVASLAELGCVAQVAACDVADREQLRVLIAGIAPEHALTGVVHAAGVLDDGVIESLDAGRLARVMAPKVDGAINLDELTRGCELSQFVLFSSVAATLGTAGQGNYAAANAFLDGLAADRRAAGLPGTALAWGPWELAAGMVGGLNEADRERAKPLGASLLTDEQGLALLDIARAGAQPAFVAARLDHAALRARAKAGGLPPILHSLVRTPARRAADASGSLPRRLAAAPSSERRAIVLELVQRQVAGVLGHATGAAIDPHRDFKELGFDSLSALEFTNGLRRATGLRLPTTLIFDHPSPSAVAEFLLDESASSGIAPRQTHGNGGTLGVLLRQAHERHSLVDFGNFLASASSFRPAFGSSHELERPTPVVPLARGELTQLICIPSFMAGSGPQQFARLADGFGGGRTVSACSLPGFRSDEAAPATWTAAIDSLAASVRHVAGDAAFVLVGYSNGVAVAHALARRLEEDGICPAGVVMIDTYAPDSPDEIGRVFNAVMATILDRDHELVSLDDDSLVSMGTYIRLVAEWDPLRIAAPSLLIRASEPIGEAVEGGRSPWWQDPTDVVEVAGHHFGVIEEAASETARVIDAWVRETIDESRPVPETRAA